MTFGRHDDSSIVFSPSVARIAATAAKDWSYIDSWLAKINPTDRDPEFERNPATLKSFLALACMNETMDEDRDLISAARSLAMREASDASSVAEVARNTSASPNQLSLRNLIISKMGGHLTREGRNALQALAETSAHHVVDTAAPGALGSEFLNLQSSLYGTEQLITRVRALHEQVNYDLQNALEQLTMFEGPLFGLPIELPKQNVDLQRKTKLRAKQITEAHEHLKTPRSISHLSSTVDSVTREERQLLGLLKRKKTMDADLATFRRLPSDPKKANGHIEGLEKQLKGLMARRDALFEGLVEQASPLKHC